MNRYVFRLLGILIILGIFAGCGGSKFLTIKKAKPGLAVRIFTADGKVSEGLILQNSGKEIRYVAQSDHELHTLATREIRQIVKIDKYYDDMANPISNAEIDKYRTNKNMWTYAVGGAVVGAVAGILIAYPFWKADIDFIPPYFVGGAGAVASSIYFANQGRKKDRQVAIQKIWAIRRHDRQLQEQVNKEKQELDKLEEEKQKLREQLKEKKKTK